MIHEWVLWLKSGVHWLGNPSYLNNGQYWLVNSNDVNEKWVING